MGQRMPGDVANKALDDALEALAGVIRVAAAKGSDAAVEFAADYLNSRDAVEPEDVANYEQWRASTASRVTRREQ